MKKSSRHSLVKVWVVLGTSLVVLSATACQDAGGNSGPLSEEEFPTKGQYIQLTPDVSEIVAAGDQIKLTATVRDGKGAEVQNARVEYESLDPSVATVEWDGTVTGMSEGVAEVVGRYGTAEATAVVAVAKPALRDLGASVTISPVQAIIPTVGGTYKFLAVGRTAQGNLVSNSSLTWQVVRPAVASISGGLATGLARGETRVIVRNGSAADTADLQVAPPNLAVRVRIVPRVDTIPQIGGSTQLAADILNGSSQPLTNLKPTWTSLDPTIASVSSTGLVVGGAKGMARIRASYGTLADTARVYVATTAVATSLYVTPKADTIPQVGGTVQLVATAMSASNQPITGLGFTWATLDPTVATVDATGLVKGVSKGTARITVRLNTLLDTAWIYVAPGTVPTAPYRVVITPQVDTVPVVGQTVTLVAHVYDKNNNEFPTVLPTWSSLNPTIASVSTGTTAVASTNVKGLVKGTAKIVAKYGTAADTAVVLVAPVVVVGKAMSVTPRADTLAAVGDTCRLRALDAQGVEINNTLLQWRSLSPAIATVGDGGKVEAIAKGTTRITVTYGSNADTATIVVGTSTTGGGGGTPTLPTIVVAPAVDTIPAVGGTASLTATVRDGQGNVISGASVTWSSLDASIAAVNASGVVTGLAQGVARIKAAYGTVADTAVVFVNPAIGVVVLSVSHNPSNPTTTSFVSIAATASNLAAVTSTSILVGGNVVKTCAGGSCTYTTQFAAGTYSYSATAKDLAGNTLNASGASVTVSLATNGGSNPGSLSSPHWPHVRLGATDYWIHYQGGNASNLYNWGAAHFDHVVGGSVDEYKRRNPSMRQMVYNLIWAPRQSDVGPMETWLQSHGYVAEKAYLHKTGTTTTQADRVTTTIWGSARFLTNPADPGYLAWKRYETSQLTALRASGKRYDGLFIDELGTGMMGQHLPGKALEYAATTDYFDDFRTLIAAMRQNTFNNIIELNIAQYSRAEDMAQVSVAGGAMTEITNSPYAEVEPAWSYIPKMMASGAVIHFTPAVAAANKNVPQQDMNAGNYGSVKERVLLWEYASYLMIVDPTRMDGLMFNPFGNFTVDPATVWLPAYETDIGFARSSRTALKSGTDPAGQAYTVWAREFDKALVLIRTKKSWSYTKYGDITAVTVTLPAGTWRMLQPDGSLVGPVTSVRLRASEAAIFMK